MDKTKEKQFFNELDEALEVFGVNKVSRQCQINIQKEYKVDGYISDYMIVVQYDYEGNSDCDYKVDEERQKELENYFSLCGETLEVKFVRLNGDDSNAKNIAKVLKVVRETTPVVERIQAHLEVLDKVKTLMTLEGTHSVFYYSNLIGVSEFELYKSVKEEFGEVDSNNINAKQIRQVMMFINSPVAKEWRDRVLNHSMSVL